MRDADPHQQMTRRPKRNRRRKYSPDDRMEVEGTVRRPVERPAPRRVWLRPLRSLVDLLPVHGETRRGREFAVFLRLMIGAAAIMMVTKGRQDWIWGAGGVLAALSSLVVPLSETRRRRWLRRLDGMNSPTTVLEPRPATLEYDGRKASIRVDGRVWRSLRPFDPPGTTRLVQVQDALWLGIIPPEGRKRDELWFTTAATPLIEHMRSAEVLEESPDVAMCLDYEAFIVAHEAFVHRL